MFPYFYEPCLVLITMYPGNRVFAENLVGLGFLQSVSYIKSIPTHEKKYLLWEKAAQNATFNLIFLGLGSSSVS